MYVLLVFFLFFFKQKTAYEMRISDWSSDVCSSDLFPGPSRPTKRWRLPRMWRSSGGNSGSVPAAGRCRCCLMAAEFGLAKRLAFPAEGCRLGNRCVELGRATGRERVWRDGVSSGGSVAEKKKK